MVWSKCYQHSTQINTISMSPEYSFQRRVQLPWGEFSRLSMSSQPWCFSHNSVLLHPPSLSVCLFEWVCVVCVCFLLFLYFSLCCAHCVFCGLFLYSQQPLYFLSFWSQNLIDTYVKVPIDVNIGLPMCLCSSSVYISFCLIYVYIRVSPSPYVCMWRLLCNDNL